MPMIELIEEKVSTTLGVGSNKSRDIENPPTPRTKNSINNEWSIGCLGKLDKRCVTYFAQLGILSTVIAVSLYQVSTKTENREFWISLLSSSIGVLVPSPKLSKKE